MKQGEEGNEGRLRFVHVTQVAMPLSYYECDRGAKTLSKRIWKTNSCTASKCIDAQQRFMDWSEPQSWNALKGREVGVLGEGVEAAIPCFHAISL